MNALRYTIFLVTLIIILGSCRRNEMQHYERKSAVYFRDMTDQDSLVYSFAGKGKSEDTLFVHVKLLGQKLTEDARFGVVVDPVLTSAQESLHYQRLETQYVFPADTFETAIPLVIYNLDENLTEASVQIGLKINSSEDLDLGYPHRIRARIVLTNQLIKPTYWDAFLYLYYGEYSKVKHEICIQLQGHDFMETQAAAISAPYSYGYWMSQGRAAAKYFAENVVYNEHGNRIMPWSAF